ncbi:GroES-like protein [Jackrogersella minutella]|nr:GroES-like protein [Jackrogersella minutella]
MSHTNSAAWLPDKCINLQVGPAPYTPPKSGQIVVKNAALAINPVDWMKQQAGSLILGYVKMPCILGGDVAGEVVEVGSDVERFRVGDRVIGQAAACAPNSNDPAEGAFQHYTVLREHLAAVIPDGMPYEQAVVLPLALLTAACGLFHEDFLALDPPAVPATPPSNNRAIIITGGASSVGSNAVQLAVSAGYQVYSTASPKNFALVEKLGATQVFDYHSNALVDDLVGALQGKSVAGAFVVGDGAAEACTKVLRRCGGSTNKFIAFAGSITPPDAFKSLLNTAKFMGSMGLWFGQRALVSCFTGVRTKFVEGEDICRPDNVASRLVFRDFLPKALATGQFIPAPELMVVGKGLDKIQEAMDLQMKGVSARKVVVLL